MSLIIHINPDLFYCISVEKLCLEKDLDFSTLIVQLDFQEFVEQIDTLWEGGVCGRKFRGFCGVGSNRKGLFPQNVVMLVDLKSLFRKIFINYPSCLNFGSLSKYVHIGKI